MFGGSRQVSVDSVAYNLAGEEEKRPDYLKSLIVGNVLSGTRDSVSQTLQRGYLNGPATKLKQFYKWAAKPENYGTIGVPSGNIHRMNLVSSDVLRDAFARIHGYSVWIQRAQVGDADYGMWVEQKILDMRPDLIGTEWTADYYPDGYIYVFPVAGAPIMFAPVNYDQNASYVYAWYNEITSGTVGAITTGAWNDIGDAEFPDVTDWTYESESDTGLVKTVIYSRMTYTGMTMDGAVYLRETRYLKETEGPPLVRSYRTDSQTLTGLVHGQSKVFIYKIGSGDAELDALALPTTEVGQFFPFIPVRINNSFLSDTYLSSEYHQCKKAYKKATGSNFDDLVEKIADNPNLADIDHAYVTFGVSLNVLENASRRYLYRFFQRLQQTQVGGPGIYTAWKAAMVTQQSVFNTWMAWKAAQSLSDDGMFGAPEPPRPVLPQMPGNEIRIVADQAGVATHYDMRLSWLFISNATGTGKGKPGAKRGELWFEIRTPDSLLSTMYGGTGLENITSGASVNTVRLYFQEGNNTYRYLDIVGMEHINFVYGNKFVKIAASVALADTDESGFVVPIHYDIWREISLVQGTQMATASIFIIFNCFKIKKAKWYQKGIFQIVFVIAIAIVSVLFTGGAGIGLLGAHMTVGAAFGLTGIAAAIAGSIVNAMAAMILSTLLNKLGAGIFGEQFAALFSAFVMAFIGGGIINFETGAFAINWGDFLNVENLLKITNVLGQTYAGHINQGTAKIGKEMADYKDNAKAEAEKIQQAFFQDFGYGAGKIEPMMFVDVASASRILAESSDTFLSRTLMTGSDIAELSRELLYNFVDYSNKLPDAYA